MNGRKSCYVALVLCLAFLIQEKCAKTEVSSVQEVKSASVGSNLKSFFTGKWKWPSIAGITPRTQAIVGAGVVGVAGLGIASHVSKHNNKVSEAEAQHAPVQLTSPSRRRLLLEGLGAAATAGAATAALDEETSVGLNEEASAAINDEASAALDEEASAALDEEASAALDEEASAALDDEASAALDDEASAALDEEASAGVEATAGVETTTTGVDEATPTAAGAATSRRLMRSVAAGLGAAAAAGGAAAAKTGITEGAAQIGGGINKVVGGSFNWGEKVLQAAGPVSIASALAVTGMGAYLLHENRQVRINEAITGSLPVTSRRRLRALAEVKEGKNNKVPEKEVGCHHEKEEEKVNEKKIDERNMANEEEQNQEKKREKNEIINDEEMVQDE